MDLVKEKMIWSRSFWLSKLLRLLILGLLAVLLTQLWNWQSQQDSSEQKTTPDVAQQVQTPVVEQPKAPVFPYTIALPEDATGPVDTSADNVVSYTYTFADGAKMVVFPSGPATIANTDTTWSHTIAEDGTLKITETPASLCAVGSAGCAAGNGSIDITSRPATGQTDKLVVQISDSNVNTKTFEQATTQYKALLETIKVAR